ncbi:MAG: RNase adapter RapZ [Arenicella sp.]|jgi:UPF0042 nucleotide-binding protein|nr:RNase adapter RapZ [Arenicella sp.]HAU67489.1 RNase adapter RapZ [Gammaproteobacteria bacterium]
MSNADFYIVSGTSGSGKTIALQVLEDIGYYCIDNLPASLAPDLAVRMMGAAGSSQKCAISIDSRNHDLLSDLDASIKQLSALDINLRIVFLDADDPTLLKRYSETRRKHPLSDPETSLREAIDKERSLLEKLALLAHRRIDTSTMTPHELRTLVREDAGNKGGYACTLLLQSFGFKYGSPLDADFVFDVRCLPNPHWNTELKHLNGKDQAVIDFFKDLTDCTQMVNDIEKFLDTWVPKFIADNRNYITVSIGCTGGQHRSVYIVEQLLIHFKKSNALQTLVRHRELILKPELGLKT